MRSASGSFDGGKRWSVLFDEAEGRMGNVEGATCAYHFLSRTEADELLQVTADLRDDDATQSLMADPTLLDALTPDEPLEA